MKIFFFDIDGTLGIKGKFNDSVFYSLKKLKEKGYLSFICSGRPPFYIANIFGDLISGYICCNGRYIVYNNKTIFSKPLEKDLLEDVKQIIKQYNFSAMFVGEKHTYSFNADVNNINKMLQIYSQDILKPYNNEKDIYTFDLFYENNPSFVDCCFKDYLVLNHHFGSNSCDCSTINYNKGSAIIYLLDYFSITKKDAYCFGDGSNDICMFDCLDNTIAMGNAINDLKQKASYVTDTVTNDGVYKALRHLNLID